MLPRLLSSSTLETKFYVVRNARNKKKKLMFIYIAFPKLRYLSSLIDLSISEAEIFLLLTLEVSIEIG